MNRGAYITRKNFKIRRTYSYSSCMGRGSRKLLIGENRENSINASNRPTFKSKIRLAISQNVV